MSYEWDKQCSLCGQEVNTEHDFRPAPERSDSETRAGKMFDRYLSRLETSAGKPAVAIDTPIVSEEDAVEFAKEIIERLEQSE